MATPITAATQTTATTDTTMRQSICDTCQAPYTQPEVHILGSHVYVTDDGHVITTEYLEHLCPNCGDHVAWDETEREEVRGQHD